MKLFKLLVLIVVLALPLSANSEDILWHNTDYADYSISAPYDLRDRESYIQVTNVRNSSITVHVQIFQHDRECSELNYSDTLTANDTVVYNLDNLIKNDGTPVPAALQDDSSGYVVVTLDDGNGFYNYTSTEPLPLIGNFRIIDNSGYEYRSNMVALGYANASSSSTALKANFNTVDGADRADVTGYAILYTGDYDNDLESSTVRNHDPGIDFDIHVYDMAEEPLSCDRRNFACGNVMNYGINEDYKASRGDDLLCPGGGLADPRGGFISFTTIYPIPGDEFINYDNEYVVFYGFIGLNNGNGTGSMDAWYGRQDAT
ncbi:MAG: hypothetical protein GTO02_20210 [Candidatus Dadabacteria bacterium]|nr:hypothetical protein [Candidatus Dadabacteria bacterium]NIQ16621.1 hypothetical protein [Candidatus Dadabacteria bacterium]